MSSSQPPDLSHLTSIPLGGPPPTPVALEGVDLDGEAQRFDPLETTRPTLLLFLGGSCDGCDALGGLLDGEQLPEGVDVVGVLPGAEQPKGQGVAAFANRSALVLRSPQAFTAYRVPAPPFFSLVSPATGTVLVEGVPLGVADLLAQLGPALG